MKDLEHIAFGEANGMDGRRPVLDLAIRGDECSVASARWSHPRRLWGISTKSGAISDKSLHVHEVSDLSSYAQRQTAVRHLGNLLADGQLYSTETPVNSGASRYEVQNACM